MAGGAEIAWNRTKCDCLLDRGVHLPVVAAGNVFGFGFRLLDDLALKEASPSQG
jgi:hypothetical protein